MKFTPEQIEEIRSDIGGTTDGAEQTMQEVARMLADHLRGLGMAEAADAIDPG